MNVKELLPPTPTEDIHANPHGMKLWSTSPLITTKPYLIKTK